MGGKPRRRPRSLGQALGVKFWLSMPTEERFELKAFIVDHRRAMTACDEQIVEGTDTCQCMLRLGRWYRAQYERREKIKADLRASERKIRELRKLLDRAKARYHDEEDEHIATLDQLELAEAALEAVSERDVEGEPCVHTTRAQRVLAEIRKLRRDAGLSGDRLGVRE